MERIPLLAENPDALAALSLAEVLYTDLDGTLLGWGGSLLVGGDGQPSLATAQAVLDVNDAGLTAVITTGRNRIQCAELARLLGWRGFIAELGCVIVPDRGADPIYFTGDWPDDTVGPGETPFELIEREGALRLLEREYPGRLEPHAPYHLNREATVMLRGYVDLEEAQALLDTLDLPIDIVDNGIVHPLVTGLDELPEIHAYHLMPAGARKQRAVELDRERRGLRREQAVAVGDSAGDVDMADVTGLGIVVANGLEDGAVVEAARARDNVYATRGMRGDGWAELAGLWVAAREA